MLLAVLPVFALRKGDSALRLSRKREARVRQPCEAGGVRNLLHTIEPALALRPRLGWLWPDPRAGRNTYTPCFDSTRMEPNNSSGGPTNGTPSDQNASSSSGKYSTADVQTIP